jgi:hypothetical protein
MRYKSVIPVDYVATRALRRAIADARSAVRHDLAIRAGLVFQWGRIRETLTCAGTGGPARPETPTLSVLALIAKGAPGTPPAGRRGR